jgi:ribosomal protein L32
VVGIARDAIKPITDSSASIGQTISSVVSSPDGQWDCSCGEKGIKGKFCSNCGTKRAEKEQPWNCACGQAGNLKNFCTNCGAKKAETWDCTCGNKEITGNFCNNCGCKRESILKGETKNDA